MIFPYFSPVFKFFFDFCMLEMYRVSEIFNTVDKSYLTFEKRVSTTTISKNIEW